MSSWKNGRLSGKRRLKLFGLSVRCVSSYPASPTAAVAPATVAAPTPTPTPRRNERRLYAAVAVACDGGVATAAAVGSAATVVRFASLSGARGAACPTVTGTAGEIAT